MPSPVSDPVREHVRKILQAYTADRKALEARVQQIEEAGGRIIDGGQVEGDSWEMTDWRTGEVIASGDDGPDGWGDALRRLDPKGLWQHIDPLQEDVGSSEPSPTEGVPPSLGEALQDWIGSVGTTDEDVAQVAGWDVADVEWCRD